MKRGEVRWFAFAAPDKRRPVLIVTRDAALSFLTEVTVAPIQSKIRDIPTEVGLTTDDGMPKECAVNCDRLATLPKSAIGGLITTLSAGHMKAVERAAMFALGFSGGRTTK